MFRTNISTLSDADLYEHTAIRLESIEHITQSREAIKLLKLMENRPILDADLAEVARKCLTELKTKLTPQTSSDYWFNNFVGRNGDIESKDLNSISDLVEERRTQIQFINAVLDRL